MMGDALIVLFFIIMCVFMFGVGSCTQREFNLLTIEGRAAIDKCEAELPRNQYCKNSSNCLYYCRYFTFIGFDMVFI